MRVVLLSRVDKDSTNNCQLKIGEHVIGRGPLLQCNSKKVSRNHAVVRVSENDGVTLTAIHHNPCFYLSKETKHITIIKNGTTIQLHDDDQIALLADEYWFKVEILNLNDSTNIEINDSIKAKKRENSEDCANDNSPKRLKSANSNEENKEIVLNAGHSSTIINNSTFDISLDIESNNFENVPADINSDLNNIETPNSRSESPDFLNSEFNVLETDNVHEKDNVLENDNVLEEHSPTNFIVTKGEVPETSKEHLQEPSIKPPEIGNTQEQKLDELDNDLLNDLSDLQKNNENANDTNKETNATSTTDPIKTAEDISKDILQTLEETANNQTPINNEKITINCIAIGIKPKTEENLSSNVEVKEEPMSDTEDNGQQNIITQPIGELNAAEEVVIKQEPEDIPDLSAGVKIDGVKVKKMPEDDENDKKDSSTNTSQPSTSSVGRERCFYGAQCYRKNPQHKIQFSHPGDSDYGDINQRPICQFGSSCFRRNPRHYQQYEHPQPPGQVPKKPPSAKTRPKMPKAPKQDYESDEEENEYDFSDPFLDDGSSDEYNLSQSADEDDDEINSQEVEEENTEENKLLLKEAKKFTKKNGRKESKVLSDS